MLLTPNSLNVLPGSRAHRDPDGFLAREELVAYLDGYARSIGAPVAEGVSVEAVERVRSGFRIDTDRGTWLAANVVVATGDAADPHVPGRSRRGAGRARPAPLARLPLARRAPGRRSPRGGGRRERPAARARACSRRPPGDPRRRPPRAHASPLSRPRHLGWLDTIGNLDETIDEVPSPGRAASPEPGDHGANGGEELDLGRLNDLGVVVCGRLRGFDGRRATSPTTSSSTSRVRRTAAPPARADRPARGRRPRPGWTGIGAGAAALPSRSPGERRSSGRGSQDVLWATGYRHSYPWLRVPVFDEAGRSSSAAASRRWKECSFWGSAFSIGGRPTSSAVGEDAAFLAELLAGRLAAKRAAEDARRRFDDPCHPPGSPAPHRARDQDPAATPEMTTRGLATAGPLHRGACPGSGHGG